MSTSQFEATIATSISVVRRERELRGRSLEQIEGEGAPRQILLDRPQFVIGRGDDADIPLASRRASRQHAILVSKGTDFAIRDNESHNGIFLNGVKIHSATLHEGDVIQVADCAFIFREG
ncbi:MAG TPA: FHA domain-containing protein [Verrucomicrobiae bacterium]|jgi:pSer/pThr/pTyr-binding forkhead associated (FHA) protein